MTVARREDGDWLDRLELSIRTTNLLRHYGVGSLEEFMELDRKTMHQWYGIGQKSWREIREIQERLHTASLGIGAKRETYNFREQRIGENHLLLSGLNMFDTEFGQSVMVWHMEQFLSRGYEVVSHSERESWYSVIMRRPE